MADGPHALERELAVMCDLRFPEHCSVTVMVCL
jgi:hypothetical protein